MLDTLPSINFGFDHLRERMAQFTARFDEFIERGRKRVLDERNHFRLNMAELQGKHHTSHRHRIHSVPVNTIIESQRARNRELEDIQNQSLAHQDRVEREAQEQEEMYQAINHLNLQREEHQSHRDHLRAQIAQLQKSIHARRQAQQQHQRQLDNQARHNLPELQFWETHLCMRIEGSDDADRLKFTFTHIAERDWDRECCFDLDMAAREYTILSTEPKLEHEAVDAVLERLIETRDLSTFLKGMRCLFVDALNS